MHLLLEHGRLPASVNRLYYACFYAVTALLFTTGLSTSKHRGALSLFDRHWALPGEVPRDMGRFVHRLFELRQRSDYGKNVSLDNEMVNSLLDEAERFVEVASEMAEKSME